MMRLGYPIAGRFPHNILLAGALALCVALGLAPRSAQAQAADDTVCANCHEGHAAGIAAGIHGKKNAPGTPASAGGCSSCHGNVAEHAKAGGGRGVGGILALGKKSKMSADERSQVCLNCHQGNRHLELWDQGRHKKMDVACNDCHNVHNIPRGSQPTIFRTTFREQQWETCATCHRDIRNQIHKQSHHPIIEGKVKCSDCHNPHGTLTKANIKAETNNELCLGCHSEKRGPYVWGHPPVEENCAICHQPHGSQHNALLAEKAPNLCQDCHDWSRHPGTYYDAKGAFAGSAPNSRFLARSCLNCHNQVHGSNAPGTLGKRFVR